jgi:hypothetical protein
VLASIVGQVGAQMLKTYNNRLFKRIDKGSSIKKIIANNYLGIITSFIKNLVVVLIFQVLLVAVAPAIKLLPSFQLGELIVIPLAIGIASLTKLLIFKRRVLYSIIGALTGVLLWVILK